MNEIVKFAFEGKNVRITDRNGNPWFVAKDVCNILGLENVALALKNHPKNEILTISSREVQDRETWGGASSFLVVNEPGFYRLIFQSRKPGAEAFKTWVFTEVLPSIRKTGAYSVHPAFLPMDSDAANRYLNLAFDTKRVFDQEREEQLSVFFDVWIAFTGNRGDYLLIEDVYKKYAGEYESFLSRSNFTYRARKMFPAMGYGPKKVNDYPHQAFFGVRFQD
jgi:prophage antirepressor-like protein